MKQWHVLVYAGLVVCVVVLLSAGALAFNSGRRLRARQGAESTRGSKKRMAAPTGYGHAQVGYRWL